MGACVHKDIKDCGPDSCDSGPKNRHELAQHIQHCTAQSTVPNQQCEAMEADVQCAKTMDCYSGTKLSKYCLEFQKGHPECELDCSAAFRAAGVGLTPVLVGVLSLSLSHDLLAR